MRLRLLSTAETELAEVAKYYESQVPGLGGEFLDEALLALGQIRTFPEAWSSVSDSLRRCRLRRFPYGLIYEIRPDEIVIASVIHLHRKPNLPST